MFAGIKPIGRSTKINAVYSAHAGFTSHVTNTPMARIEPKKIKGERVEWYKSPDNPARTANTVTKIVNKIVVLVGRANFIVIVF